MRRVAILVLFLLSLLVAPMVAAKPVPPSPCVEKEIAPGVSLNRNCGLTVEVALMSCPLTGSWKEYHVGNDVVRVYTCDPPQ